MPLLRHNDTTSTVEKKIFVPFVSSEEERSRLVTLTGHKDTVYGPEGGARPLSVRTSISPVKLS